MKILIEKIQIQYNSEDEFEKDSIVKEHEGWFRVMHNGVKEKPCVEWNRK